MNEEQKNRELDWEDEIENVKGFIEIPDGDYDFIVDRFERSTVGGEGKYAGQKMAVVYCNIQVEGEPQLKANLIMNATLQWKLAEFFISIGQMENEENARLKMNWPRVGGSRGRCTIEKKPNYNDRTKFHSEITKFLPPTGKKWSNDF